MGDTLNVCVKSYMLRVQQI